MYTGFNVKILMERRNRSCTYSTYSLQKVGKMSLGGVSNIVGRPDNEQQQQQNI